jgi:purine-nucleoside phosphorylase
MKKQKLHPTTEANTLFLFSVYAEIEQAVYFLKRKFLRRQHKVLVILGSGLGESLRGLKNKITVSYQDIPHFPISTAPGHAGKLISARLGNKWVLVMQGRPHMYEGNSGTKIAFPIRVAYLLGVRTLVITNACGGLREGMHEGDIMIIKDHINLMNMNSLIGPNLDRFGKRFPDMHQPYDKRLVHLLRQIGEEELGLHLMMGVFTAISGPAYETPAEMRMMRTMGIDATGMSTVQECIVANHCTTHGPMRVAGISIITDICNPDSPNVLTEEDVIRIANQAAPKVGKLITAFIKRLKL